jgi:3-isopropylmalate dehydrogenase
MQTTIAVLEGDGIGPEIVREAVKVLRAIERKYQHTFVLEEAPFGAGAYFTEGAAFPARTQAVCDAAEVILKGPVGLAVDRMAAIPQAERPEIAAILPLRQRYDTFANFRPVRLPATLAAFSPLRPEVLGPGLDILMIRELVGGIYFGAKTEGPETGMAFARDDCTYTAPQVRRVARVAFEEAARRGSPLVNIHKANVLATSRFWNALVEEVGRDFPEVSCRSMLVDNAAFQLVTNPSQFNGVMLLENMQGDILTDQAGGVVGSLGLMPSACIGPDKSYVEPAHGSAPDIAGQDSANPFSMIGSAALLLERCLGLAEEARDVWEALFAVFEAGYVTREFVGRSGMGRQCLGTAAFGDRVVGRILKDRN